MPAVLAEPAGEQLLAVAGNAATRYRNHTVPLLTHLFYRYRWEIGSIASCSSLKAWKPLSSTAIFQVAVVGGTTVLCCGLQAYLPPSVSCADVHTATSCCLCKWCLCSQWLIPVAKVPLRSVRISSNRCGRAPCETLQLPPRAPGSFNVSAVTFFFLHTPKRIKGLIMRDTDFFWDLSHYSLRGCSMLPNMKVFDEAAVCQNGASKSRECTEREHT